jgi:hypothetical protein
MDPPGALPGAGAPTVRANAKEIQMPKGQQRGNREAKKPKQPKKAATPPSSSIIPQAARPMPAQTKKR